MNPRAKLTTALVAAALAMPAVLLYFHGPAASTSGLSRSYYNAVSALTPCPEGALNYEDAVVSFSYLDLAAAPDRSYVTGPFDPVTSDWLTEVFKGCTPADSIVAGNIVIGRYSGCPAEAAGDGFKAVLPYLRENFGAAENSALAGLPGKPGAYYTVAGLQTHIFFRDSAGTVYWYHSPKLPMLAGRHGFFKELSFSAWNSGSFGPNYIGLGRWFSQPAEEKRCLCNFDKITATLRVK